MPFHHVNINMKQNPLSQILIQPNVIDNNGLTAMVDYIKIQPEIDLSVFDPEKSNLTGNTEFSIDKKVRDTQLVEMGELFDPIVDLYRNIVKNIINPFYNITIKDSELPQILKYHVDGHYSPHVDGQSMWKSPNGDVIWRKSTDRDLSTVIFLNDDFEGGEFVFPEYRIRIKPEPGLLVCFPSTHQYIHGVEPVTKGVRYSMVNWMTISGVPTLAEEEAELMNKYNIHASRENQWQNT